MLREVKWHKIAHHVDEFAFKANNMTIVEVEGEKITIANFKQMLYAFAYKCPHASGIMAEGYINTLGNIVCPLHRYAFSLDNGRNVTGEGYYLKMYKIEQREEGIYLGIEKAGIFG